MQVQVFYITSFPLLPTSGYFSSPPQLFLLYLRYSTQWTSKLRVLSSSEVTPSPSMFVLFITEICINILYRHTHTRKLFELLFLLIEQSLYKCIKINMDKTWWVWFGVQMTYIDGVDALWILYSFNLVTVVRLHVL